MDETLKFFWEVIKMAVLALAIVLPIRYFLFQPFVVNGGSMNPNFEDGDYLIVDEITYRFRSPVRGEVVVFHAPTQSQTRYIKRIVGLPGERVVIKDQGVHVFKEDGEYVLDESFYLPQDSLTTGKVDVKLSEDEYFLLGDNRSFSSDSRSWGPLSEERIIGRAFFRVLPLYDMQKFKPPVYGLEEVSFLFYPVNIKENV